jgi:polyisoprenoid-binding protein YceI
MTARRWLVVALVVVVVVVGAPFAYINFIKGDEPARFKLSATGASGGSESVPLEGTWSIGPGSQAGYRVGEVLAGQDSTAVGRTTVVSGSMTIKGTSVESGSFTADMRSMKSEQRQRDGAFQRRIMDTATYPTATFALSKPIEIGSLPASGVARKYSATGNLTMRGMTKPITIPITADHAGTQIRVVGRLPIVFAEWNIPNPSFAPLVTTKDQGELEFLLNFTRGAPAPAAPSTTVTEAPASGGTPPGPMTPPTVTPTTLAPLEIPSSPA